MPAQTRYRPLAAAIAMLMPRHQDQRHPVKRGLSATFLTLEASCSLSAIAFSFEGGITQLLAAAQLCGTGPGIQGKLCGSCRERLSGHK